MLRHDHEVPPGSFDYLLGPQRPPTRIERPVPFLRRKVATTETPKPPPPTPPERGGGNPRIRVEIEINQRPPQRRPATGRWVVAAIIWAVVLSLFAMAHAEQWRSHRDGFLTRSESDQGDRATTYRQGFEALTTIDRADGSTQRCRSWQQGWQTFTECH